MSPRARTIGRAALVALVAACGLDALLVEPRWVEVTHPSAPPNARLRAPVRVLHVTDLHGDVPGTREARILEVLDVEKPDLVVLTGDSTDRGSLAGEKDFLARLRAPLGVFAVRGNWEHWKPAPDEAATYAAAGITLLVDEARRVRNDLWVVGFDDPTGGHPNVARALRGVPEGVATLGLVHSPVLFEDLAARMSFVLAGHTHGGQVRVPLLGAPWLPPGSGRFVAGAYEADGSWLYVSRGIGTSLLPVRFACRPELPVVRLAAER